MNENTKKLIGRIAYYFILWDLLIYGACYGSGIALTLALVFLWATNLFAFGTLVAGTVLIHLTKVFAMDGNRNLSFKFRPTWANCLGGAMALFLAAHGYMTLPILMLLVILLTSLFRSEAADVQKNMPIDVEVVSETSEPIRG
jgi:hypothetical protein